MAEKKEYIEKASLYNKLAELEDVVRKKYLDAPACSTEGTRLLVSMQERGALKHLIADTPAADVVEVVRCKNCKHNESRIYDSEVMNNCCSMLRCRVKPDDFCSHGEKRKEEERDG